MESSALNRRQRDALIHAHLKLADAMAQRFHNRYRNLTEADDLTQVARLELVRAAERVKGDKPEAYLERCIQGALLHYMRDRALLVRRPKTARCESPWTHDSLDRQLEGGGCPLDLLPSPEPEPQKKGSTDRYIELLLDRLPAREAAAVRLTVLEGLSLRDTAQQLGASTMTVQRPRSGRWLPSGYWWRPEALEAREFPIPGLQDPLGVAAAFGYRGLLRRRINTSV
jgi:RNA polymerase sigma-B factor